jgi:hypothetical protein
MVGDYISTSVRNGTNAFPTVAVAPMNGVFNEAMYVPTGGLQVAGGARWAVSGRSWRQAAPAAWPLQDSGCPAAPVEAFTGLTQRHSAITRPLSSSRQPGDWTGHRTYRRTPGL